MKHVVSVLFTAVVCFVICIANAMACTCLQPPTVLEEFERSAIVMIVSFDGLEETGRTESGDQVFRTYNALFSVEKSFKDSLKVGQSIRIVDGYEGVCGMSFTREKVGQKFLLYTRSPSVSINAASGKEKEDSISGISICSRSKRLERAAADLRYLENREKFVGQTRLSGTLRFSGEIRPSAAGITIAISGSGIERSVRTDEDGFFEVWGLPAGDYAIKYEVPEGWKIWGYSVEPSPERRSRRDSPPNHTLQARIERARHTEVNTYLNIDNQISGKVLSSSGSPIKDVCVSAYWLTPTSSSFSIPHKCTDKNGDFKIAELPPGKYRLEMSCWKGSGADKRYYPDAKKPEEAEPISIDAGTQVRNLVITMKIKC